MKELCTQMCTDEPLAQSYREEIASLVKNKKHCRYFLDHINKFRIRGEFKLSKYVIENIGSILNDILDHINIVKDYENAKYCLIISQTYFFTENEKKIFLQTLIENHILLKQLDFWETYIACIVC